MSRPTSRLARRRIAGALLALALSPAAGCGYVHDYMAWRHRGATVMQGHGGEDSADVTKGKRDRMREARAKAWASIAKGGSAGDYSTDDALALSAAARALDARVTWEKTPAAGRATLADLPRTSWWYLFAPPSTWARGPLALDREQLPGFYAAMMDAMEHVVTAAKAAPAPLTADRYLDLHRLATLGVFDREAKRPIVDRFAQDKTTFAIAALHDVGGLHVEHLVQSLAELKAEGVAGWNAGVQRDRGTSPVPGWLAKLIAEHEDINPHNKPTSIVFEASQARAGSEEWLVGVTTYAPHEAETWAAQWLADYAQEIQKVPHRSTDDYLTLLASQSPADDFTMALKPGMKPSEDLAGVVRPIARLVRRLQVSHLFGDRVDAVDTRLLLNYLLATNGLPPAIVEDGAIFAGREPLDELVAEIVKGQQRYQVLVRELAMRDTPKPAPVAQATP